MPRKRTDDSSASGFALLYQMSFAKTLNEMNDNVQIVRYMETRDIHFMMQYKAAIKYLDKVQKDVDESDFYRTQGNVQYSQRNYVQALELFNQSICFAPEGSVELSKGYANRSAVYLSLKMYGLCLENIKLARDAGYPKDLMSKLDERQTKCENGLKKQKVPENEFNGLKPELTYPPHEKVPFIANCLELKRNQRFGRHIVAKSDLKVGDIIAIERPFNNGVVAREIRYNCCANCLNDNDLSLIPCSSCHSAMFCSQKCYAEAKANFHDIECPIMSVLFDAILLHSDERLVNVKEIVAVRLLIALIRSFESLDQLMRFVKDLDNREQNVFTIDYAKNEQLASLAAILQLERNQTKSGHKMKNSMGLATGIIYKILLSSTALKEIFKTKEEVDFFIGIFYRFVQVINFSSFPVTNVMKKFAKPEEKTNKYDRLCYGIYPFSSLMNHSCAPNTVHIKHGLDNVIIVIKPVKAGEQLFISYEVHHFIFDRKTRLDMFTEQYAFKCECLACRKDYPRFGLLDLLGSNDCIQPAEHLDLIYEFKVDDIKALIPKYCAFLNVNSRQHFPEKHTKVAEKYLWKFWKIVYLDKISLSLKQKYDLLSSNK